MGTGPRPAQTSALPEGFRLPALSMIAEAMPELAEALGGGAPDETAGLTWFGRVDRALRSAEGAEIVELARRFRAAQEQGSWDTLLRAATLDSRAATELRRQQGRLRSLWGITPIISLQTARQADRLLGVEAESLVLTTYHVTKNFDLDLSRQLAAIRAADPSAESGFYWLVLLWAMLSYDVFFFYNDRGILPPTQSTGRFEMGIRHDELALLSRAGKLIYTLPYGADYRTRERTMNGHRFNFCMDCPAPGDFCFCNGEAWPAVFHVIAAYATAMLSTGLARRHLAGSYRLDYVVVDTDLIEPCYSEPPVGRKLRILHVPNHVHFKGTRYLEAAVARLPPDTPVEFVCRSGLNNSEVLDLMRRADLVVDQLIGGFFGQTALEAMSLGKPVIAFIADRDLVAAPEECPIINADPDSIFAVLRDLAGNPGILPAIGRRSRQYVEMYYSVPALAERLRVMYAETAGIVVPSERRGTGRKAVAEAMP